MNGWDGSGVGLGGIAKLSDAVSRSISAENFTGEKGKGGMAAEGTGQAAAAGLGQGWKVSPSVWVEAGTTLTLAEIDGPYSLEQVPDDAAYFHAQWRRNNPLAYGDVHTILDGVGGKGHFVGVYLAWQTNSNRWWGEGEVKFFLDGDDEFPTICGTGTEDYFGGAWNWDMDGKYVTYSTAYLGMHQHIKPDGLYKYRKIKNAPY